jgi:hypothetical protein
LFFFARELTAPPKNKTQVEVRDELVEMEI